MEVLKIIVCHITDVCNYQILIRNVWQRASKINQFTLLLKFNYLKPGPLHLPSPQTLPHATFWCLRMSWFAADNGPILKDKWIFVEEVLSLTPPFLGAQREVILCNDCMRTEETAFKFLCLDKSDKVLYNILYTLQYLIHAILLELSSEIHKSH